MLQKLSIFRRSAQPAQLGDADILQDLAALAQRAADELRRPDPAKAAAALSAAHARMNRIVSHA